MDKNLKEIQDLCNEIDASIPRVNSGGCCVVAAELAAQLSEHYPTRIRVGNSYTWDDNGNDNVSLDDVASNVKKKSDIFAWNDQGIYFGHVIVEIEYNGKKYHIDSTGVHKAKKKDPAFGFALYEGSLSIKHAKKLAGNGYGWNDTFDRGHIPLLKQIVNNFFKSYAPTF